MCSVSDGMLCTRFSSSFINTVSRVGNGLSAQCPEASTYNSIPACAWNGVKIISFRKKAKMNVTFKETKNILVAFKYSIHGREKKL